MTPNTMTLDEVRDELARMDGWNKRPSNNGILWYANNGAWTYFHPHPATLDGAAAALPEGWSWIRGGNRWSGIHPGSVFSWKDTRVPDTGDELLDRYRLALSCRLAEVKQ